MRIPFSRLKTAPTSLAFTDTLPPGVTIADPSMATTDYTGAVAVTLTAPLGGSIITLN